MTRAIGLVFLVGGIILVIYGINAINSPGSDVSRFFTGAPTNKALWLTIGGAACAIAGGVMTLGRSPGR
jgi:hypothetical protein